jgi:hypothetical protein
MSIRKILQNGLENLKDGIQATLSFITANAQWLIAFNNSPAGLVLKPILGLVLMILLINQAYELHIATEFDLAKAISFAVNLVSSTLTNAAIVGGLAALIMHLSFALGPWLMISAFSLGLLHQVGLVGYNVYKTFVAENRSIRMHHLQASINNLFNSLLVASAILSSALALASPAAPVVLSVFAVLVTIMLVATLVWRSMPNSIKQKIKHSFGIEKPEAEELDKSYIVEMELKNESKAFFITEPKSLHPLRFWTPKVEENENGNLKQVEFSP